MAIYLDERTSLALIRAYRASCADPSLPVFTPYIPDALPWPKLPAGRIDAEPATEEAIGSLYGSISDKTASLLATVPRLSLLVESADKRRRATGPVEGSAVEGHELPKGSLCTVAPGLVACTPAFALARLAQRYSLGAWLMEAMELCGVYARTDDPSGMPARTAPVASERALSSFFDKVEEVRGISKARRWAPFVLDGAASPSEAQIAALFSLPVRHGGYGLPRPLVNHPLSSLDGRRRDRNCEGARRVPDFSWPDRHVTLEYDSDLAHTGDALYRDARRRNEIESGGFTVVTLTRPQLHSPSECDLVARQLSSHLGYTQRRRDFTSAWRERNRALRVSLGLSNGGW